MKMINYLLLSLALLTNSYLFCVLKYPERKILKLQKKYENEFIKALGNGNHEKAIKMFFSAYPDKKENELIDVCLEPDKYSQIHTSMKKSKNYGNAIKTLLEIALYLAVARGDDKMVSLLLNNAADPNIECGIYKKLPIYYAIHGSLFDTSPNKYIDIFKELLVNNSVYKENWQNCYFYYYFDLQKRNHPLMHNVASSIGSLLKFEPLKNILKEIIDYKTEVFKKETADVLANAIANSSDKKSAFTEDQWLTFAILNRHYEQIDYCLKKEIVTPFNLLKTFTQKKQLSLDLAPHLVSQINNEDSATLYNLAKKHNNKKLGKMISEIYLASRILMNKKNKSSVILSEDVVRHITSYFSYTLSK